MSLSDILDIARFLSTEKTIFLSSSYKKSDGVLSPYGTVFISGRRDKKVLQKKAAEYCPNIMVR